MKIFILEDSWNRIKLFKEVLEPRHTLFMAESVDEGKQVYTNGAPFDLLMLDHDLEEHFMAGDHPNTGSEFCRWLVNVPWASTPVIVHSFNPDGADYMYNTLAEIGGWPAIMKEPFSMRLLKLLETI